MSLTALERAFVAEIERRRDELVELLTDLICFDTTARQTMDDAARDEAALQQYLASRLDAAGFETELWEPTREEVAGHR